jgi:hypothetical protein
LGEYNFLKHGKMHVGTEGFISNPSDIQNMVGWGGVGLGGRYQPTEGNACRRCFLGSVDSVEHSSCSPPPMVRFLPSPAIMVCVLLRVAMKPPFAKPMKHPQGVQESQAHEKCMKASCSLVPCEMQGMAEIACPSGRPKVHPTVESLMDRSHIKTTSVDKVDGCVGSRQQQLRILGFRVCLRRSHCHLIPDIH